MLLAAALTWLALAAPAPAELDRLLRQLGRPEFAEREAATQRLRAIGEPALETLRKAAHSDDPEVRRRAAALVEEIENLDYERLQGTWECTADGGPRLVFRREQAIFERGVTTALTFRLAPREDPPAIDFLQRGRPVLKGIYTLKGDDLELCLPVRDDLKRPRAFAAGDEKESVTLRFKRRKPVP